MWGEGERVRELRDDGSSLNMFFVKLAVDLECGYIFKSPLILNPL